VSLPTSISGTDDMFILKANGDSMIDAEIDDEDYVVVSMRSSSSNGDIVVAHVENESTLKRFDADNTNQKVILHPEDEAYKGIITEPCVIQGVAKLVIKAIWFLVQKKLCLVNLRMSRCRAN
jgi:repressor LexA